MICHVCGQPAVGQCQSCWRFYCKEHGNITCKNCEVRPLEVGFGGMQITQTRRGQRRTRSWPRPPRLSALERVIPVAMSQTHGRTEVTVVSVECYDDCFLVNYRVGGGPPSPRPKLAFAMFHFPHLGLQATDDAGTVYDGLPMSSGGGSEGFRGIVCFSPRLNPAASILRLTVEEVQWMAQGPGQRSSVEPGPWRFDIPLKPS